jgi:hypothetical protein
VVISASWFFSKKGFANHMPLLQFYVKQDIRISSVNKMFLFASLWGRGALLLCKNIQRFTGIGQKKRLTMEALF